MKHLENHLPAWNACLVTAFLLNSVLLQKMKEIDWPGNAFLQSVE